jgi:ABC-type phosphate transport system substrate-binding protein
MRRIAFGIILLVMTLAAPVWAQVAVVAHPSVPAKTIDSSTLLDIYAGDIKTWVGGEPIVLLDLKAKTPVKVAFYEFLGMSPSRMKSIWMKNMLAGEGSPPETIETDELILQRIASTPGAIGYASLPLARRASGVVTLLEIPKETE